MRPTWGHCLLFLLSTRSVSPIVPFPLLLLAVKRKFKEFIRFFFTKMHQVKSRSHFRNWSSHYGLSQKLWTKLEDLRLKFAS